MPSPTRRTLQREETRERLFDVAVEEFLEVGFADARIGRIVERAGVARGTFYFHFPTKDHVLYELSDRMERMVAEGLELPADAPFDQVLRLTFDVLRGSDAFIAPELQRELLAAQLRRAHDASRSPLSQKLGTALTHAQARGEVRVDIDADDLATTLLASVFGTLALSLNDADPGRALDVLLDTLLLGTLTKETAS